MSTEHFMIVRFIFAMMLLLPVVVCLLAAYYKRDVVISWFEKRAKLQEKAVKGNLAERKPYIRSNFVIRGNDEFRV